MSEKRVVDDLASTGTEIAGYRITSVLGKGGMGTVYLAERPQGGLCALKVLTRGLADDASAAARFKREAQYAEALENPNILELYEAGEASDGTLFLAMQYVPGEDLGALLAREGPMDLAESLSILGQVSNALDAAHARGLIHRDVKPGNIIVAADRSSGPYAFLTDFGLSKNPEADSIALTKQGQFVGTTAYTAPEEILGQPRDQRVDVYSLGCVLFESLAGEPPFVRDRDLDVMYAHIGDPRPLLSERRPGIPPQIDEVLAKAMAIAPDDRYPSCAELIAAAVAVLPTEAAPAASDVALAPAVPAPPAASGSSPRALRLVVRHGPAQGHELLVAGELELGRLTTLEGALAEDRLISRRHSLIRREPDGGFVVEDLYSANGTYVNGVRIEQPHPLVPGDELRIGSTALTVGATDLPEPLLSDEPQVSQVNEAPEIGESGPASPEVADLVVDAAPSEPLKRVAIHLELDLDAGRLSVAIEHGPTARIVRDGNGWRVEIP